MSLADRAAISGIVGRLSTEFVGVFSIETLDRYVAESWEQLATTAKIPAFLPVLAERFARERLRALGQAEGVIVSDIPEVLFVCVHNAGRSQMAAALLDWRALPESDLARMTRPFPLVTDDLRAMSEEGLVEMEFSGDEYVIQLTRLGELFYEQAQT